MAEDVYNSFDVAYDSYLEPDADPFIQQIIASTAITSINGVTGPTVTFSGGTSGFSFVPGGTTISLLSPLTTKGDLYTWSTLGIRLPVGSNNDVLTADSGVVAGVKWAPPATAGTVTHTGTLTANQLILGNGTADVTALGSLGTTATVLHGNAAGAPTFAAVSLTADVSGTLPIANGGTNDTGTAWTTYTPTVTSGAGTLTTVSANGYYKTLGKTVWIHIAITITTNGTGSADIRFTLPIAPANNDDQTLAGILLAASNIATVTYLRKNSTTITPTTKYDGTYPGGDGNIILIDGTYESV